MNIVAVNTSNTGKPAGWWYGNPNSARNCDYLVEERNGKVYAVYTFDDVSECDSNGRFSFKGLKNVNDSMIFNHIKERLNLSRVQGEANPVRYFEI